jgi:hypothetical protein
MKSIVPDIDYRCEDKKRVGESIGLDSLFQKTPMFTARKQTVKPGDVFENTAFE